MKKKVFILGIILIVMGFATYKYIYQEHRDIAAEKANYTDTVKEIFDAFATNDSLANAKYLDKTIEIHGKISNIDFDTKIITVDKNLSARFTEKLPENLKLQDSINLKGRLTGFNDLLEEIEMDQCVMVP
ncbi:OB-fold protein [Flavobacterium sp.]|uniref:OB-fold protein n=1 Tax=Flavobacterium sp. TaxID=239 RepID=UPI00391D3B09